MKDPTDQDVETQNSATKEEAADVVNYTVFIVSAFLVILIVGLLTYFFIMRQKTIKIKLRQTKHEPKMLSIVTTYDGRNSPDKILPYPNGEGN